MSRFSYGLNYLGSKNALCDRLFKNVFDLYNCDNFVDLFGGGGSMTHYCKLHFSEIAVYYNEINYIAYHLFKNACHGILSWLSTEQVKKYCNDYIKIWDKEDANLRMQIDVYWLCKYLMSFSGVLDSYGYGKFKNIDEILINPKASRIFENYNRYKNVSGINLNNLFFDNLDYRDFLSDVFMNKNNQKSKNVIYCDIPYNKTQGYGINFNQEEFLNCIYELSLNENITNTLFYISSYEINDSRFKCIFEEKKHLNIQNQKDDIPTERIYIPINQNDTTIKLF